MKLKTLNLIVGIIVGIGCLIEIIFLKRILWVLILGICSLSNLVYYVYFKRKDALNTKSEVKE